MTTTYRLGIPVNLPTGATYDLLHISFPDGYPEGKLVFDLESTPRKITGIQKVAQTFIKTLFTTLGSDLVYPNKGTLFSTYTLNANRTGTDTELYNNIISEIKRAESQTKFFLNTAGADLASQLQRVTVLGLDVGTEAITLYLKMVTAAGQEANVAIPFPELNLLESSNG
jgi:hypothetical protein